jgi:phosphonoacetate hydrolase
MLRGTAFSVSILTALMVAACGGKEAAPKGDGGTVSDLTDSTGPAEDGMDLSVPETLEVQLPDRMIPVDVSDVDGGDGGVDGELVPETLEPDVPEPVCLAPPESGEYLGSAAEPVPDGPGIGPWEGEAFETLAEALLAQPNIFFVDTYNVETGLYEVRWAGGFLAFERTFGPDGPTFAVVAQEGTEPFGCTDPAGFNTYASALAAGTNPMGTSYPELGYEEGDPRVVFIPTEEHCYPLPLLRIAQLYDAPNAPDFHYSPMPWGVGSGGSHGALDVLQSRAPLVIAGHGLRQGFEAERSPLTADIAPTVLHLMGAQAGPGLRHGLDHSATWLAWQDGEALPGLWEEGACVEPFQYAFILLFDGLNSNELVHLYESGEVSLPAFQSILDGALIFRNGATVGFPSVSVPGHLTVGTGMLNGHHRFIGNGFYYRSEKQVLSPGNILAQADRYLADPQLALDLFDFIMNPAGETLFEAAHRHFGDGVFTASVNELTLRGADHSLIDMASAFAGMGGRSDYYDLADQVAIPQVLGLLDEHAGTEGKMLFFLSFYGTDDAGESGGPHGAALRQKLVTLDLYMGKLLERLDALGIRDRSLIVLTADHGMELQDKNRSGAWAPAMQATGLKYLDPDGFGFVYLPTLRPEVTASECGAGGCTVTVTVRDANTEEPVPGATVTGPGDPPAAAGTDETGLAVLSLPSVGPETLSFTHPDYNPATVFWTP